jgi:hypothetical protein
MRTLYENTTKRVDDRKSYYKVKCFIKDEAYPKYKYPRAIFARVDDFKIRIGPVLKAIEKKLFSLPCFIKKVPVPDRPRYLYKMFGNLVGHTDRPNEHLVRIYASDFTSFESSFDKKFYEGAEFWFYLFMISTLPEKCEFSHLLDIIKSKNMCIFKFLIVFLWALRMSGENTTSIGNGFANCTTANFIVEFIGGIVIAAIFEGDDCLMAYVGPMIDPENYKKLGFLVKPEYFNHFNEASFCGQLFDIESMTVIADPIKYIMNLAWVSVRYRNASDKTLLGLLRSRAMSLLYQYPGCPIIQAMALCYYRITQGYKPVYEKLDEYHMDIQRQAMASDLPVRVVEVQTRLLMQRVFGITVIHQLMLEKYFNEMNVLSPMDHHVIDYYTVSDWAEFNDRYVRDYYTKDFVPQEK